MKKNEKEYSLVYLHTKFDKSDSEYKEGDWNCYFKNGKKEIRFRRTKTLEAANLVKGKKYILKTDWLNNPIYVKGSGIEITRLGNKIIRHDIKKGSYYNLTHGFEVDKNFKPLNGEKTADGKRNLMVAALNKFGKGQMTEADLKKMNSKGTYFKIHSYETTGNSFSNFSYGFDQEKNHVLIEKYKQEDIDRMLTTIKQHYLRNGIEKCFEFTITLLPPKTTKKKK